jgi:subtilisin family serine protease
MVEGESAEREAGSIPAASTIYSLREKPAVDAAFHHADGKISNLTVSLGSRPTDRRCRCTLKDPAGRGSSEKPLPLPASASGLASSATIDLGIWIRRILLAGLLCFASASAAWGADPRSDAVIRAIADQPRDHIAIEVVLREPDLDAGDPRRWAEIAARRATVLTGVPAGQYTLRRRYRALSGFATWASAAAIDALARHPEVVSISLDRRVHMSLDEGAPLVGADAAHTAGWTGSGITVAVLDTGFDSNHPDLANDLIAEACFCNDHPSPNKGCCPDESAEQTGPGAAEDDEGHGTSVSGIITSDNAVDLGVAPNASIVAVKVLDSSGSGSFSDVAAALDWVLTSGIPLGVDVVNLSLGDGVEYGNGLSFPCTGSNTANAIALLAAAEVAVFVASGNDAYDNGIQFPACTPEAISVGGVYDASLGSLSWCANSSCSETLCTDRNTSADKFVCHTNSGLALDLLAPDWKTTTSAMGGGKTDFGGTSAASPYAAAQAAILLEADDTLTPDEIRDLLVSTGTPVINPDNGLSFPRADVEQALIALPEPGGLLSLAVGIGFLAVVGSRRAARRE